MFSPQEEYLEIPETAEQKAFKQRFSHISEAPLEPSDDVFYYDGDDIPADAPRRTTPILTTRGQRLQDFLFVETKDEEESEEKEPMFGMSMMHDFPAMDSGYSMLIKIDEIPETTTFHFEFRFIDHHDSQSTCDSISLIKTQACNDYILMLFGRFRLIKSGIYLLTHENNYRGYEPTTWYHQDFMARDNVFPALYIFLQYYMFEDDMECLSTSIKTKQGLEYRTTCKQKHIMFINNRLIQHSHPGEITLAQGVVIAPEYMGDVDPRTLTEAEHEYLRRVSVGNSQLHISRDELNRRLFRIMVHKTEEEEDWREVLSKSYTPPLPPEEFELCRTIITGTYDKSVFIPFKQTVFEDINIGMLVDPRLNLVGGKRQINTKTHKKRRRKLK